ncbi:MAG: hypothetical protein EA371_05350 [Gammaproteobacteria bacterium]|nr:MAG: hypothetical protein EA371_05350 [Gammaproteobacteria bacterium]
MKARPHGDCYWVRPGAFLAGEYPAAATAPAARRRLARLLDAGVDSLVDLTAPHELPAYAHLLQAEAELRGLLPRHRRFPIPDHGVPEHPDLMDDILAHIDAELAAGRGVYLHCRAGIGRTGMVVACWLVAQGASPEEALAQLADWWRGVEKSWRHERSPETDEQVSFVEAWGARRRFARD